MEFQRLIGLCAVLGFTHSAMADGAIRIVSETSMYGGSISAPCTINGRDTSCKIDLGANMSSFRNDESIAALPSLAKMRYRSMTGQAVICDMVSVPKLAVGQIEKSEFEASRCPVVDIRTELNIVGLDFFAGESIVIDYKNSLIRFGASSKAWPVESYTTDQVGHVLVAVKAGHKYQAQTSLVAMVDTGAAITVIDRSFVERNPAYFQLIKQYDGGKDTHGNPLVSKLMIVSGIEIGGHVLTGEYVMATDLTEFKKLTGGDVEMIIGHNLMKHLVWLIDFSNRTWAVTKP